LIAVSFWGAYVGRVGLRASMLPAFVLAVGYGVWVLSRHSRHPYRWAVLTGLALGGSLYTYTSAFALFAGVGLAALLTVRRLWRVWVVCGLVAGAVAAPMVYARLTDREGFNRASTITRPLTEALAGNPQQLASNALSLAGMFAFTGDPEARYGIPGRPMFPLWVGVGVYLGVGVMLWRMRRQPVWAYMMGVGVVGLVPSLLTVSAPSMLRSVAVLPVAALAVGLVVAVLPVRARAVMACGLVGALAVVDWRALWVDWPRLPEVQAIYRDDLEALADHLAETGVTRALVSTPDVALDAAMLPYELPPTTSQVSFFDGETTLAIAEGATLYVSPLAPIYPSLAHVSGAAATARLPDVLRQDGQVAFEVYQLGGLPALGVDDDTAYLWGEPQFGRGELARWAQPLAYPVNFGGVVELVGVNLTQRPIATQYDGVNLLLHLRPLVNREVRTLQAFAHVYRQPDGALHAQRDLLGAPTLQWQTDMVLIQDTFVVMGDSPPGQYVVAVGFYDYVTGARLPVLGADGQVLGDRVLIGRVRVE
jgi:hypothetical protein